MAGDTSSSSSDSSSSEEESSPKQQRIEENSKDDDTSSDSNGSSSSDEEESASSDNEQEEMEEEAAEDAAEDEKMDLDEEDEQENVPAAPTLSRSWIVRTVHDPIFTGGKVVLSRGRLSVDEDTSVPFLLLPVGGDIALVDANKGIKLDSIRGETQVNEFDDDEEEGLDADSITAYALTSNDKFLVTCSQNSLMRQYSVTKQEYDDETISKQRYIQLVQQWGKSGHTLPVTNMEFHTSNVFLATASVDGSVRIWDVRQTNNLQPFVTHSFRPIADGYQGGGSGTLAVTAIRWVKDVATLQIAIARDDGSIAIHNLRNSKHVTVLRDHVSAVTCMDWNTERSLFVSTGRDSVINLWRVVQATNKKKKSGQKVQVQVPVYDYKRIHTLPLYEQIEGMAILPPSPGESELVATAGGKGAVRLWQVTSKSGDTKLELLAKQGERGAFGEQRGGYSNLLCDPLGLSSNDSDSSTTPQLIVADAEHNLSFLPISRSKDDLEVERCIVGHNDDILDLKVIPTDDAKSDVTKIAVVTNSAQVRLFDAKTFSCSVLDRHTATVLCVDVSPCGGYLATCGKDKQVRIWHTEQQKSVALATGHTEAVGALALSKKVGRYSVRGKAAANGGGAFVVTASSDKTLKRWNLPGSTDLDDLASRDEETALSASLSIRAHDKDINTVSIAPNDSYVATGSQDKTAKIWRATDLSLVATLKGHRRGIWDCQFSPYDRVVATASGDKTIKLWSLGDFSCVRTFQGHVASVLRVRFLCGGLQLVSSGSDGLLKVWTIRTNECEATLNQHVDKVWAMDLCQNGKTVVSGGADSKLIVWDDNTQQVDAAKRAEEEEAILFDQQLSNHMRQKEFKQALKIALQRDKPQHSLKIITAMMEDDLANDREGSHTLLEVAPHWTDDEIKALLRYCRDWNTLARHSAVALHTIKVMVSCFRADTLAGMEGVPEILAGILPYAERHYDRIDRLFTGSYLLDFALFSMGDIGLDSHAEEYKEWESNSRLMTKPTRDGRIQIGGSTIIEGMPTQSLSERGDNELVTIGESSQDSMDSSD